MMNIESKAFEVLATDRELHLHSTKVILYLLSVLSFDHWKKMTQTPLIKDLQIDQSNLSKTIRFLKSKNMIAEQNRHYRLVQWW
jgi:DNA-binding MarR family transcriptional regulator